MMRRAETSHSKEEVMELMEPLVRDWFESSFPDVTEPQGKAIPLIHDRRSVLVSSPTGSGKTLTAFLSIINELTRYAREGELEDRVYCIYVSPLKALANDVNRNLEAPLAEMRAMAEAKGESFPDIRVAVRSGDTSQYERQKMVRNPPHILITTPESLALILSAPRFRESFNRVEWVIVDEIHDICDSKRGAFLSLTLERLQEHCQAPFTRIGLSATLAPIEDIAGYLVGWEGDGPRDVTLVESRGRKELDLQVLCPAEDMTALPFEIVNSRMYDLLKEMVDQHRTTLIFTNTRSGAESVVFKLKERGLESIEAHHSSLSKEIRLDVEERLKRGELRCVVSSTSLELGIDIGSVDLVCQVGSPKSVAKGLQRIGRSGHGVGEVAKGRLIVFDQDDLVECAVLSRAAHEGRIDRVFIPENCLDVLAQTLVGMSLDRRWELEEVETLVRGSYCFRNLPQDSLLATLRYLGSRDEYEGVYAKLWFDEEEGRMGRRRGSRMIYFLNLGTIPEEANYRVISSHGGRVGELSERFVERLAPRDVFVLGGRSFEFVRAKGMSVYVKEASGRRPTVPSWTGEMLPRSFDLSMEVARFRGEMASRLDEDDRSILSWLTADLHIDEGSARSILSYFREQAAVAELIPDERKLMLEEYVDPSGNHRLVFHFPFGRRVNDALSRAYARNISNNFGVNVSISVNDDNFMISSPRRIDLEKIDGILHSKDLEPVLRRAVRESELFKQRFRHTAARSFMILRNYRGRSVSVNRQQVRSAFLLESLERMEGMPVIEETYREVMEDDMDIRNARQVLEWLEDGTMSLELRPFDGTPSPFAHSVILSGFSDIVLMEDRSALLRELHRQVLARAMGGDLREFEFEADQLVPYFREKAGRLHGKEDIVPLLMRLGPLQMFRDRGRSVYAYSDVEHRELDQWCRELLEEGEIISVFLGDPHFMAAEEAPYYASACARQRELGELDERLLDILRPEASVALLASELDVTEDSVLRSLRKLESMYLVARIGQSRGRWSFAPVQYELPGREASLDRVILRHLRCHAPLTAAETAFALSLDETETRLSLDAMVEEGEVARGRFLVSEQDQYMLRLDLLRLRSGDSDVMDHQSVERYRLSKGRSFPDIESFFRFYGWASHTLEVFRRVENFRMEDWEEMRRSGRILMGRFVRGRVRYILAEDLDLYVQAFREEGLSASDEKVLNIIRSSDGATMRQLGALDIMDKDALKDSLYRLDRNGHLARAYDDREDWGSENHYVALSPRPYGDDPWPTLVARFLRANGPVSPQAFRPALGLQPEEGRALAMQAGAISLPVGSLSHEMLLMPEEAELIMEVVEDEPGMRLLSRRDPDAQPRWAEIMARYGDRRVHPFLRGPYLAGAAELWETSETLDIRSLDLERREDLADALEAIDQVMEYQRERGVDVVRIWEVMGQDAAEPLPEDTEVLLANGYQHVNGFFAKGDIAAINLTREQVTSLAIRRQRVTPEGRHGSVGEALLERGYLRGDWEALLRSRERGSLKLKADEGHALGMVLIPPYVGYASREQAILIRAAQEAEVDEDMRMLISLIKDRQPIARKGIFEHSTLGEQRTQEALRRLHRGSIVYTDGSRRYSLVPLRHLEPRDARRELIHQAFRGFGSFTAEQLSQFMGPAFSMREIRTLLWELEAEGKLRKGFLLEEDVCLRWILVEEAREDLPLEEAELVLLPQDNLHVYLRGGLGAEYGGSVAVILSGPSVIGSFLGKLGQSTLAVDEFQGDELAWRSLRSFARSRGLAMEGPDSEEEDWDPGEFYRKTHPGGF